MTPFRVVGEFRCRLIHIVKAHHEEDGITRLSAWLLAGRIDCTPMINRPYLSTKILMLRAVLYIRSVGPIMELFVSHPSLFISEIRSFTRNVDKLVSRQNIGERCKTPETIEMSFAGGGGRHQ